MTAALTFDVATHRYALAGRELISVTQALTEAGFIDSRWYTEDAARRGTAVHAAVERFHATGAVAVDDETAPFFDAYLAFQQEAGFVIDGAEERVCDPACGYAGTLDLRGRFARFTAGVDVIDIKTGAVPVWVGYQVAAYARLVDGLPRRRWVLQLRADGTYRLEPLTARTDERVFLAALLVAQAKRGWV
jgi:hypothetical protein